MMADEAKRTKHRYDRGMEALNDEKATIQPKQMKAGVCAIVPGMGTTLEGAERLELEFPGHQFLPPIKQGRAKAHDCGVLEELNAMNALHCGLFCVLQEMGLEFTAIVGLSASEPCALKLAGALDDKNLEGVTNVCADIYNHLSGKGSMLLVFNVPKPLVLQTIAEVGGSTLALGAWFGAAAGAVTGNTLDVESFRHLAQNKGWKHMDPRAGFGDRIPFHCPSLFEPYREDVVKNRFDKIAFSKPQIPYYSSYTGGLIEDDVTTINGDFMFSSMAETAHSFDAICSCIRAGYRKFVELNLEPLYGRTVEEAFAAERVEFRKEESYTCCGPSRADLEALVQNVTGQRCND